MTPSGSVLRFGETWFGDQLNLTTKGRPYDSGFGGSYAVRVDFSLENTSDSKLNFDMLTNSFYLEFNDGIRFPSSDGKIGFNDFGHGDRRDFSITWNLSWNEFQAKKRNPVITNYVIGMQGLHARLREARWRDDVFH